MSTSAEEPKMITIKTTAGDGLVTHIVYKSASSAARRLAVQDGFTRKMIEEIRAGKPVERTCYTYEWILGAVELEPYWM